MKALFIAAATAALASAACPNQCSGHGTCSGSDLCSCYDTWMGADCSQRKCAEDRAWAVNSADPHAYAECSGQGVCNRASGECECFDGFTGRACARSTCPNDCSGHGKCKLLSEVDTTIPYDAATNWDAKRIQTCDCDAGYFGSDCSLRKCPTGDDPLTLCKSDVDDHVQEVRLTLGSKTLHDIRTAAPVDAAGYTNTSPELALFAPLGRTDSWTGASAIAKAQLRVHYTDSWGGVYTAHPVDVSLDGTADAAAAQSLELALEALPDRKVNDVTVNSDAQAILNADGSLNTQFVPQRVWQVTFNADKTNSNNVGLQNALQCDSAYSCTEDGCQPKVAMPFLYRYAATSAVVASTAMSSATNTAVNAYAANLDTTASFVSTGAVDAYNFIRLNAASQPQLPAGIAVDAEANRVGATNFNRYDIRVLVAVVDGNQQNGVDDNVDSYYTRVVLGHTNITSAAETIGKAGMAAGVWTPAASAAWNGFTLDGFTYGGPIPSTFTKVPVPGAPGVFIDFPARNIVSDTKGQWFEILVKLPNCQVTPVTSTGAAVHDLAAFGTTKAPIDPNVENIECSGRGQCNRKSGQCECYTGYYGLACQRQTTLV